ncbi:MAG: class I SAM-dependent methyltransferase [Gemmatimonadaceae bacterium]|nr:class I SAM-dependent methyltransferase [Gemmatimonadaceae bacterium]
MHERLKRFLGVYSESRINDFIEREVAALPAGSRILDLGCGSQRYRKHCDQLRYYAQDWGKSSEGLGSTREEYVYGQLDYLGNCWNVDEESGHFDAILCTEVLEHVPYPEKTIREIARLLRPGGKLLLTAPLMSLRHMNPHWFQPGLSDNWYEFFLPKYDLSITRMDTIGDYAMLLKSELVRVWAHHKWAVPFMLPAIVFMSLFFKADKSAFRNLACMGYHIVATKTPRD